MGPHVNLTPKVSGAARSAATEGHQQGPGQWRSHGPCWRPLDRPVRVSGLARRCPLCKGNWLRCGKVGGGTAKDRTVNGAQCPTVRVVKGDVIGTGESMRVDIPFERLSKTTYPRRCRLPPCHNAASFLCTMGIAARGLKP